jgi:hypothetical protein
MHQRSLLAVLSTLLICLIVSPSKSIRAQSAATEKPAMYTYVSLWTVPRGNWPQFEKSEAAALTVLNKLASDGTVINYGNIIRLNHQEGEPTHADWFSSTSLANLMKALESLMAAGSASDPVFANTKHWDHIFESRDYASHSGTLSNSYLRVGVFKYKEGAAHTEEITRATIGKALDGMMADGSLHAYFLQREYVHTTDVNSLFMVLFTNGAEGLDKFTAAVASMAKNDPAGLQGFESIIDDKGHVDELWRVTSGTFK